MKKFIYKTIIYGIGFLLLLFIFINSFGSYIDYFYLKFTTPKASSMVIGDSRSFQGIQPELIDSLVSDSFYDKSLYNYSFTIGQFSYDSVNYISMKRKHNEKANNGLYILSIHPWVLSEPKEGIRGHYNRILKVAPHTISDPNKYPNIEYMFKHFDDFNFKGAFRRNSVLHKTGWLENRNLPKNEHEYIYNCNTQYKMYQSFSKDWKPSDEKILYLKLMISYFKIHGTVILVQMPIDEKLKAIERQYWDDFDEVAVSISKEFQVLYLNYNESNTTYEFYDGNHLNREGSKNFSIDLANKIHETPLHY